MHPPPDLPDHYAEDDVPQAPLWLVWGSALLAGYVLGAVTILPLLHLFARWGWLP